MKTYKNLIIKLSNEKDIELNELRGDVNYNPGGVEIIGTFKDENGDCYKDVGFYPYHTIKSMGYKVLVGLKDDI